MEIEKVQETPEVQNVEESEIPQTPAVKVQKRVVKKLVKKERKEVLVKDESAEGLEEKKAVQETVILKKPRTEGQIASFKKALEVKKLNAIKRKQEMDIIADQQKKELEKKILKKALSIKKKEVRSRLALESISDDDEPVDSVLAKARKIASKAPKPVIPPVPQWTFA